jgi:hypothetical protein
MVNNFDNPHKRHKAMAGVVGIIRYKQLIGLKRGVGPGLVTITTVPHRAAVVGTQHIQHLVGPPNFTRVHQLLPFGGVPPLDAVIHLARALVIRLGRVYFIGRAGQYKKQAEP